MGPAYPSALPPPLSPPPSLAAHVYNMYIYPDSSPVALPSPSLSLSDLVFAAGADQESIRAMNNAAK